MILKVLSAEVRENLDLNQDNIIGSEIEETLFNPQGGGSDRRCNQTKQGLVVSREHLSEGTDLKSRNIVMTECLAWPLRLTALVVLKHLRQNK